MDILIASCQHTLFIPKQGYTVYTVAKKITKFQFSHFQVYHDYFGIFQNYKVSQLYPQQFLK